METMERPKLGRDLKLEANGALDQITQKLHDILESEGRNLLEFRDDISVVRETINTHSHDKKEANTSLDRLVQEFGSRGFDLNELGFPHLRDAIHHG
ncbi:MAG: hypothetical protein V1846_05590 [Candidatus Komeilibacteria bacterium]